MVTAKNKHTGVESTFTDAEWARVQEKKAYANTFSIVNKEAEKPKEVPAELKELKTKSKPVAAADEVKEEKADKTKPQDKTTQDKTK